MASTLIFLSSTQFTAIPEYYLSRTKAVTLLANIQMVSVVASPLWMSLHWAALWFINMMSLSWWFSMLSCTSGCHYNTFFYIIVHKASPKYCF